ncbi:phosphotransferase family protein [Frankia sp. AiPs1]|uniref:phosphotransferase family protein n=1 Tax=Frankia sp. AiPs1 TaxID=573493 RepID=UPI00204436D7|nr:phosphotransferase family protein [Frankia sp. AiPs1]MCM3923267.1 phosphotransferase family protein [Frankia sp. AiPs1]
MADTNKTINLAALTGWLDDNVPSLGAGPLTTALVSGGSTNLILSLDRGGRKAIFRSPPLAGSPQGARTIQREATVLRALTGTDVPSPEFLGFCADDSLLGVSFYVMELVDGWAATITAENETIWPAGFDGGPDQHYICWAMTDGLVALANLDYTAVGLGGFGRPEGFLERQPDRWLGQVDGYRQRYPKYEPRDLPGLRYVADWLRDNVPAGSRPALIHADYAPNNALFHHRPPARLAAIIDWETATIGDPLLDLAAFVNNLVTADEDDGAMRYFQPGRFPHRDDVIAYYGEQTGRDVSTIGYYSVLSKWRAACMIEYKVAESIQGLSPKAKGDRFDAIVRRLLLDSEALARSLT